MRLKTAVDLFLSRHLSKSTIKAYRSILLPLSAKLGDKPVREIRPADLIGYVGSLNPDYSPATRNKIVKGIKALFNWLIEIDELEKTPAGAVKVRKPPREIPREKAMSDIELETILRWTYPKPRDYALILFLADTGCRAGGAAGLKVKDIDLTRRRAIVTEKGQKTRPVVFGEDCANAIRRWLLVRKFHGEYVFSRIRTPLQSAQVGQIVRRACLAAGVRSLGSHSLRHRKGHQFADNKIAPSIAATALGHSNVHVTLEHYYPTDFESAEEALRQLATDTSKKSIIKFKTGS